jgi:hypothetical protein
MSTNKTTNLDMHSWVSTDLVKLNEFNDNFSTIDTEVGSLKDKVGDATVDQQITSKVGDLTELQTTDKSSVAAAINEIAKTSQSYTWTAAESQTVFTLPNSQTYTTGVNAIDVYVGGIPQASGTNYTETSSTSFTLAEGVAAGTPVYAKWQSGTVANVTAPITAMSGFNTTIGDVSTLGATVVEKLTDHSNEIGILLDLVSDIDCGLFTDAPSTMTDIDGGTF